MNINNENLICKDSDGNIFISVEKVDESKLSENQDLTHCLAIVKIGSDHILGFNKWRNRYEIFGGCIEKGESARECIIRECSEELGLNSFEIVYLGAMKLLLMPDYFSSTERIEFGGLYGITLPNMNTNELFNKIKDKQEITKLALYSEVKSKEPIAEIDEKLLEYFK